MSFQGAVDRATGKSDVFIIQFIHIDIWTEARSASIPVFNKKISTWREIWTLGYINWGLVQEKYFCLLWNQDGIRFGNCFLATCAFIECNETYTVGVWGHEFVLSVCGLFCDAVSAFSDHLVLSHGRLWNDELEGIWKETFVA